jgi:hypothetical protein
MICTERSYIYIIRYTLHRDMRVLIICRFIFYHVNVSLCLTKHHSVQSYVGMEV